MRSIQDLSPTEFEHLIYDLLIVKGMTNLVWRTPGRDGGRDLEGYFYWNDISGSLVEQHWYIECKKYASSVNWPTVFEKMAYAKNAKADSLLLVTTATFSPQCLDEIKKWNESHEITKIRTWALHDLEWELPASRMLMVKYGLIDDHREKAVSLLKIAGLSSKYIQSAYNKSVFQDATNTYIDAAAALSEFLLHLITRLKDGSVCDMFDPSVDGYEWLTITGGSVNLDRFFLRAIISIYRLVTKSETVTVEFLNANKTSIVGDGIRAILYSQIEDFELLAIWADCEITVNEKKTLFIVSRR